MEQIQPRLIKRKTSAEFGRNDTAKKKEATIGRSAAYVSSGDWDLIKLDNTLRVISRISFKNFTIHKTYEI
jgi:hypothetical protein